jgi:ABC-type branched-subunit amino acid transport system ATPase component
VNNKSSLKKNGEQMLLEIKNVNAGYGFLQILRDVNILVKQGEYVCLVGPNGAGKSTLLKTIVGHITPNSGEIWYLGKRIDGLTGNKVAQHGISYISEGMNLFLNMTVEENLKMGAYLIKDKAQIKEQTEYVYELFPRLTERKNQLAGTMSGGERKMLAIGRGLMLKPILLLVDEPSFGLAPLLTESVFYALEKLNSEGMTILLVEQNVTKALSDTGRGYIIENGQIKLEGESKELSRNPYVNKVFLGV